MMDRPVWNLWLDSAGPPKNFGGAAGSVDTWAGVALSLGLRAGSSALAAGASSVAGPVASCPVAGAPAPISGSWARAELGATERTTTIILRAMTDRFLMAGASIE